MSQYDFLHLLFFLIPEDGGEGENEETSEEKYEAEKTWNPEKNPKKYSKQWRKHVLFHSSSALRKNLMLKEEKEVEVEKKFC